MGQDMTVPCGDGYINIRVGAIIIRNGRVLMAKDDRADYYYSVGGRVQFGETAQQAIVREVEEETGTRLEIDRLGFVHQNYFISDVPPKTGKTIYELSLFFYMKVPEDFPLDISKKVQHEFIEWVPLNTEKTIYPEFFKTELLKEHRGSNLFPPTTDKNPRRKAKCFAAGLLSKIIQPLSFRLSSV